MSHQPTITTALHTCATRLHTLGDPDTADTVHRLAHDYASGKLGQPQVLDALHHLLDAYDSATIPG